MSTAVPRPANDHWPNTSVRQRVDGADIAATGTMAPPNSSCGISTSGMKLVACSWLRTAGRDDEAQRDRRPRR